MGGANAAPANAPARCVSSRFAAYLSPSRWKPVSSEASMSYDRGMSRHRWLVVALGVGVGFAVSRPSYAYSCSCTVGESLELELAAISSVSGDPVADEEFERLGPLAWFGRNGVRMPYPKKTPYFAIVEEDFNSGNYAELAWALEEKQ